MHAVWKTRYMAECPNHEHWVIIDFVELPRLPRAQRPVYPADLLTRHAVQQSRACPSCGYDPHIRA